MGGFLPVLVGLRVTQTLDVEERLGAEEFEHFPLKLALAESIAREMN
jgi:hypothetical protein